MARSQFKEQLDVTISQGGPGTRVPAGQRQIEVKGPLVIAGRGDYEDDPIRVQFQIVQVPRGQRSEEDKRTQRDVTRVRDIGEEVEGGGEWRATVPLGNLRVGPANVTQMETRGVAIAVLERKAQFAFDTITWCDEIELVGPAKRPSKPKKRPGKRSPAKKPRGKASPAKRAS